MDQDSGELLFSSEITGIISPATLMTSPNQRFLYAATRDGRRKVEVPKVNQYALQAVVIGRSILSNNPLPSSSNEAV
jgi:D-xylose 1-dehydrogenase (NADP+, D-xylono-1,5-lactone-forming)